MPERQKECPTSKSPSPLHGFTQEEVDKTKVAVPRSSPRKQLGRAAKTAAVANLSRKGKNIEPRSGAKAHRVSESSLGWDYCNEPLPTYSLDRLDGSRVSTSTIFDTSGKISDTEVFDTSGDLQEEHFQSPESSPNTSGQSGDTVVDAEMALPADIAKHLAVIDKAQMLYDDDYAGVEVPDLHCELLSVMLPRAEGLKTELQHALIALASQPEEVLTSQRRQMAMDIKSELIRFIRAVNAVMMRRQRQEPATPAQVGGGPGSELESETRASAIRLKRGRVVQQSPGVIEQARELGREISTVVAAPPETDTAARFMAEKFTQLMKKVKLIREDFSTILETAIELGMEKEVQELDTALSQLRREVSESEEQLSEHKQNLGIIGDNATAGNGYGGLKAADLKAPQFSGELGGMDYYTFKRDFDEYISTKTVSRNELLRFLLRSCLQGAAKEACKQMTSQEDVFTYLKDTYGNPRILFNARVDELRKLGPCQGSTTKKRDWAIAVKAHLVQLNDLAADHDLEEELWFSPIVTELQSSLPERVIEKYKKLLKAADAGGNISRKRTFNIFFNFMSTVVQDFTFDVNYQINNPRVTPGKPAAPTLPTEKAARRAASAVPDPVVETTANAADDGRVYTPPAEVQCSVCPATHTYVYYCPVYIAARVKDRFGIASKAKACFRCLRADAEVDVKNREVWLRRHAVDCQTTWICQHPECQRKEQSRQLHFTLCGKHINYNRRNQDDFVNDLDPNLVPSGTRYFTCFPQTFAYHIDPSYVSEVNDDKTVLPDVNDESIFLLQDINVNGRTLMMFYDSGCMGAGISYAAADALESRCVRPGPTWMHVAGGRKIRLETGDEQFKVLLGDGNTYATMTALKIETVTTPMPLWHLKDAWKNIQEEYSSLNPDGEPLPLGADKVGGCSVDFVVEICYHWYFPALLYTLTGGLSIQKSKFSCPGGRSELLGGPHKA